VPASSSFDAARALALARATLDIEARALDALKSRQGDGFVAALGAILACRGRVVVMGMGKSGHVGRKVAATLASTGTPAFFVHPGEATPIDVPIVRDVIEVAPVEWAMVPGTKAAMVRIIQFSDGTADELRTALAAVADEGGGIEHLVAELGGKRIGERLAGTQRRTVAGGEVGIA